MKGIISYQQQKNFIPSLFIGMPHLPGYWQYDDDAGVLFQDQILHPTVTPVTLDLESPLGIMEHQTAGYFCNHIQLFGVFFRPGNWHQLKKLYQSYEGSCLGVTLPSLEEIEGYQAALQTLGLGLDPGGNEYRYLQEGFLPCSAVRMAELVLGRGCELLVPPSGEVMPIPAEWKDPQLLLDWIRRQYIDAKGWLPFEDTRLSELHKFFGDFDDVLVGAIIHENCD